MNEEKIAIVLTTYNPNYEYFIKQIDSIRTQTWQNWICYIVDDQSAQEYQAFIHKVVRDDSRFICYFHDENVGVNYNFERGLKYCLDDKSIASIAFSDQDDIWLSNKLEQSITKMRSSKSLMLHHDLILIDEKDELTHNSCWEYEARVPENMTVDYLLLRNIVNGCTLIFCSSLLCKVLPFPSNNILGHDHWVGLIGVNTGLFVSLRQPLIRYRIHSTNVSGVKKNPGGLIKEFRDWILNGFKVTGNSYLIQLNKTKSFYDRFQPTGSSVFDDKKLDFGLRILILSFKTYITGFGSSGVALRLCVLKFLFDSKKTLKSCQLFNSEVK